MKIAINAQLLSNQESYRGAGVSNYSRELLRALSELVRAGATEHYITAYVHAPRRLSQRSRSNVRQRVSCGSRARCPYISGRVERP